MQVEQLRIKTFIYAIASKYIQGQTMRQVIVIAPATARSSRNMYSPKELSA